MTCSAAHPALVDVLRHLDQAVGNHPAADPTNVSMCEVARREDVAPGQSLVHQTGLHRWRPGLAPEPQRAVRPNEIVVAPQELDVSAELVFATRVAWERRRKYADP